MLEEIYTQAFWIGLMKIIGVNLILSGDNAVVIALAARSLPQRQQKAAVLWGSGAAVAMRIVLTIFAVALLTLPWLKLVGSLLLFWIGIKLLVPEEGDENIDASDNLISAIKTILIADLVMSIDNVIAVAAAAQGSMTLLVLGLAISIPLVIFGSTLLLHLMERWPIIITIGGGLLGFVAGEMLVTDPVLKGPLSGLGVEFDGDKPKIGGISLEILCGLVGAVIVIAVGTLIGKRRAMKAAVHEAAVEVDRPKANTEQPKS
jgi:YjbE family integral membrane protein